MLPFARSDGVPEADLAMPSRVGPARTDIGMGFASLPRFDAAPRLDEVAFARPQALSTQACEALEPKLDADLLEVPVERSDRLIRLGKGHVCIGPQEIKGVLA